MGIFLNPADHPGPQRKKKSRAADWFWVALCILSIFLVIPVARSVRNFVETRLDIALFGIFVLLAVGFAFGAVLYVLWFKLKVRSGPRVFWLAAVAATYTVFTLKLWRRPEEAIHFLEYGLLGVLLFRALRHHIKDRAIYIIVILTGAIVGLVDEAIQWVIPLRYWDLRDVGFNTLSCILSQVALLGGIRPEIPSTRVQARSARTASVLLAALLVLLGLSFSNTPDRVEAYTSRLAFLSFLRQEEPMYEPKFKHTDPKIGVVFFSRLTLEEIEAVDRERAEEYGRILADWKEKPYADFLRTFPGYARPFLYEMRVHIFRRDAHFSRAFNAADLDRRKEHFLIAHKENRILEKYFGRTLARSPYCWPEQRTRRVEEEVSGADAFYRSPVGAGLTLPFNETAMWGIIAASFAALFLANVWHTRRGKHPYFHDGR